MEPLRQHQRRALKFLQTHPQAALWMDMGLGKTRVVIELIKAEQKQVLVLAPLRVATRTWPEEIKKWHPNATYNVLHGPNKSLADNHLFDYSLLNYEGLPWFSKQTCSWIPRGVIYDESTFVKSHATKRFKLLKLAQPLFTDRRILLSATPAPNSLIDLWAQYYLLDQGERLGKNISIFRKRYCESFSYPGMPVQLYRIRPGVSKEIYDRVSDITLSIKAKDADVDLPPIVENKVIVPFPAKYRAMYKNLERDFCLALEEEDSIITAVSKASLGNKLSQFTAGGIYNEEHEWSPIHDAKIKVLKEIVESSAGRPVLCCIQYRGSVRQIAKAIPQAKFLYGGIGAKAGNKLLSEWNDGLLPLLVVHPASISHGLNLQAGGNILVWMSFPWSFEQYFQTIGRLHRQGQKERVINHHLVMENTVDEKILKVLAQKEYQNLKFMDALRKVYFVD